MRTTDGRWLALLGLWATLASCAWNRTEITLPPPMYATPMSSSAHRPLAIIRTVVDDRIFQDAPSDPKIPSLGFGGAGKAPASIKARAVVRKRNGLGDVH